MKVENFALVTNEDARDESKTHTLQPARDYIEKQMQTATDITIISAYYGEGFTKEILKTTKSTARNRKLTFVFAAQAEVSRKEQIEGLKQLEEEILEQGLCRAKSVEIRLGISNRFLHAKLFRFRSKAKLPVYVLGSANLSSAAFKQNDEVMVVIKGRHPGLNSYIDHILRDSVPIDNVPALSDAFNWRAFLRNAYLYYRPNRTIAYSIDPFADDEFKEVAERLRDETIQPLPFSDPNVLTINLVELLELKVPENSKLGFQLPTYSIETDYGYWVPRFYVEFVEERLRISTEPKRRSLEKRGKELQKAGDEYTRGQINIYLEAVGKRLKDSGLMLSKKQKTLIYEKIVKRVKQLTGMLTHEKYLDRLARPLVGDPVPEFWEDQASVDRFFEAFCSDIVSKLNAPKSTPKIVTYLAAQFGITAEDDDKSCREKIEDYFNQRSWPTDYWPLPPEKD